MQFIIYGNLNVKDITAALARHGQRPAEPAVDTSAPGAPADAESREQFFAYLQKNQWELMTDDMDLVHRLYEEKIRFNRTIVLILPAPGDAGIAIDRLFARYPRLSARRLYSLTPGRVKIRQLPGAV